MVYQPPKASGLAMGFGALLGLLAVCAGSLTLLATSPPSPLTLVLLAGLLAAVPALAWFAYRLAGLLNARYILTRNALTVEWGGRREVIPLPEVEEVHAGLEFPGGLRPPALNWPGCVIGRVQRPDLGALEYLATTADKAGLVLIGYSGGWLALSPRDPAAFLAVLAERRAEGVDEPVEPESAYPELPQWPLWRDRLALGLILAGALAVFALLVYLVLVYPQLPAEMALRFDPGGRPLRFGPPAGLFTLVLIGAGAWAVNTTLGILLHRRQADRAAAYLLLTATLGVQVMIWVAAIGLLTAGT